MIYYLLYNENSSLVLQAIRIKLCFPSWGTVCPQTSLWNLAYEIERTKTLTDKPEWFNSGILSFVHQVDFFLVETSGLEWTVLYSIYFGIGNWSKIRINRTYDFRFLFRKANIERTFNKYPCHCWCRDCNRSVKWLPKKIFMLHIVEFKNNCKITFE